jgi:hypothetical protein
MDGSVTIVVAHGIGGLRYRTTGAEREEPRKRANPK